MLIKLESYTTLESFNKHRLVIERDLSGFRNRIDNAPNREDLQKISESLNTTPTLAAGRKTLPGSAQRELKGSARKRTTDYKSILSNLERQRKQDEAEKAKASTPNKSWNHSENTVRCE